MLKMGQQISVRHAASSAVCAGYQEVLPDGPVDLEGVAAHVRGQRAVGAVHVGVRPGVRDDREFGGRDGERGDASQALNLRRGGHEDGRFAAFLREQLGGVDAPGGSRGGDAAGVQGRVQLPERPEKPRQQVADADGVR